ncbi:MAG: PQQ-binding-like beta-propeller repeat protein [Actinomycetota bacterium]
MYMGASNGTVYARDLSTGALVWKHATGGPVYPPAVAGSTVYVTSVGGDVIALDASTGALQWSESFAPPATAPAVANGVVYFGRTDGKVQALRASNGAGLGNVIPANDHLNPRGPVVANGVVYFTATLNIQNSQALPSMYAYGL